MKTIIMNLVGFLEIFSLSSALPIILHPPVLKRQQERSDRIYFQNSAVISPQYYYYHAPYNYRSNLVHFGDNHDKIFMPDAPEVRLFTKKEPAYRYPKPGVPISRNNFPTFTFRHSLGEEGSSSSALFLREEKLLNKMRSTTQTSTTEQSNGGETQTTVSLSFLEQWARNNAKTTVSSTAKQSVGISSSTTPPTKTEDKGGDDYDDPDKSLSFQSLFQIPRLSNSRRHVSASNACPAGERKNHHGKCVKLVKIIMFDDGEDEISWFS